MDPLAFAKLPATHQLDQPFEPIIPDAAKLPSWFDIEANYIWDAADLWDLEQGDLIVVQNRGRSVTSPSRFVNADCTHIYVQLRDIRLRIELKPSITVKKAFAQVITHKK
jgi:hypothetical protein